MLSPRRLAYDTSRAGLRLRTGKALLSVRLVKQTRISSIGFFAARAQSHFFAPLDQHAFRAVNLVDAYSAANFATGISTGDE
jgi:hypothetical protein